MDSRALSVREAALFLGVRTEEVYRLLWTGKLEGNKGSNKEWSIPRVAVTAHKRKMRHKYG